MANEVVYLSITQAAEACGVSRQAVWLAIQRGRFPPGTVLRIGNQWAVTPEGLRAAFGEPRHKKMTKTFKKEDV